MVAMEAAPTDTFTARLPVDLLDRVVDESARRDWSRNRTINRAIEIGLAQLEAQIALPFAAEAS